MKKGLVITLLLAGAVLGGGALFLTFGGNSYLKKAAEEYTETVSIVSAPFPYAGRAVPEDYSSAPCHEWTVSVPMQVSTETVTGEDTPQMMILQGRFGENGYAEIRYMLPEEEAFDPDAIDWTENRLQSKLIASCVKSFAKKHGFALTDRYSFSDMLYHLSASRIKGFSDSMAFYYLAQYKNAALMGFDNIWSWSSDTADGFIRTVQNPDAPKKQYTAYLSVSPKDNRNLQSELMLIASDEETLRNMLSSVQYDPAKAAALLSEIPN